MSKRARVAGRVWTVIQYGEVDIRGWGDPAPRTAPVAPVGADVVVAATSEEAIGRVATQPGFYAALPVPDDLRPSRYELVEVEREEQNDE